MSVFVVVIIVFAFLCWELSRQISVYWIISVSESLHLHAVSIWPACRPASGARVKSEGMNYDRGDNEEGRVCR